MVADAVKLCQSWLEMTQILVAAVITGGPTQNHVNFWILIRKVIEGNLFFCWNNGISDTIIKFKAEELGGMKSVWLVGEEEVGDKEIDDLGDDAHSHRMVKHNNCIWLGLNELELALYSNLNSNLRTLWQSHGTL